MNRSTMAALGAMTLLAAACGGSAADAGGSPDAPITAPAVGSCLEGDPDCDTIGADDPLMGEGETGRAPMLEAAAAVVGQHEDELPDDVRVGRRGEEFLMLTEDYVVGRITVELDADQAGDFRVVAVTLEAADGPVQIGADGVVGELADGPSVVTEGA